MGAVWRHYWIAVGLAAMTIPLPDYLSTSSWMPLQRPLSTVGYEIGSWRGRDQYVSDRIRAALGTDDILLREYLDDRREPVWLYISYFGRQQQGEASHSPQHCLPGAGWQPVQSRRVPYPLAGPDAPLINEIVYEKEGRRQLVFYWYRERGRVVASEYLVKWYLMWDAMTQHRTDGALVRVSTPVEDTDEVARERAQAFMRIMLPGLNEFFPT